MFNVCFKAYSLKEPVSNKEKQNLNKPYQKNYTISL